MKILLIAYDNDSHISYFPMGLAYIASAIKKAGHQVSIYHQDIYHFTEEHLEDFINSNAFDMVGVGACGGYYQYEKIKKIAYAINQTKSRPTLVLGGHLPSPDPEFFLRKMNADFVCIGESEITIAELINALEIGEDLSQIDGIAYISKDGKYHRNKERQLVENIDEISYPAYELFPMEHYALNPMPNAKRNQRTIPILSGRGCNFECNFCYRLDKGFRPRSAKSMIDEIVFLKNTYKISYFNFQDELFMSSKKRIIEACSEFIAHEINISWSCNGRLNYATKEVLQIMKDAGCVFINYGIESLDDRVLRNMNKSLTVEQIVDGIENTLEIGISPGFNIIFGNIGENKAILDKGVDFLLKYDDHSQLRTIRPVTPYPGSPLFELAIKYGKLEDCEDFYENKHKNSELLTVNFTDLTDKEFYEALYSANLRLLKNYYEFSIKNTRKILDDVYIKKDSSFRGYRKV